MNENRVQFEPEGLIEVVESNAEKSLEELTETIVAETLDWCHDKQLDDITLVLAKRRK
jgi:serine phosphatase RsbU (regulator of sigma subunit)